jgi:phosphohistidine phosphatase SixA
MTPVPPMLVAHARNQLSLLALLALACLSPIAAADHAAPALGGPALREALLRGGYVIYFRHASTDFGQNDERMTGYEDCARQRNLTERGRDEARAIGVAMRRLRIPVTTVWASPFCRTRETAELIFGRASADARVRGGPARTDDAERYGALRTLLSTPVAAGSNVAIVSHGNPFHALAGPPYLAEGEAAIVEPLADRGFKIVAKIRPDGWGALSP